MVSIVTNLWNKAKSFVSRKKDDKKKQQFYGKSVLILLGPPGVGKGTYGKKLSQELNMPIFSTGDYLRAICKDPTNEVGKKVKGIMNSGGLVDDDTIMEVIDNRLFVNEDPKAKGIIFDGFPRTVRQAELLEKRAKVNACANFILREDILKQKLCGRRVCDKCGIAYNVADVNTGEYVMPPLLPKKDPKKCDECNIDLVQRKDDTLASIEVRLKEYREKTAPLEEFYKRRKVYVEYEPKKGLADYPMIKTKITEFMAAMKKI